MFAFSVTCKTRSTRVPNGLAGLSQVSANARPGRPVTKFQMPTPWIKTRVNAGLKLTDAAHLFSSI